MVDYTDNHELALYAQLESPWEHRSDFETIDRNLPVTDRDANRSEYIPKTGALYFATDDPYNIYLGDGASWLHLGSLAGSGTDDGSSDGGSGGDGTVDPTTVEGIVTAPANHGPPHQGAYHDAGSRGGRYGIMFWAEEGVTIHSAVVDTDLSGVSTTTLPVQLTEYNGAAASPTIVDSVNVTVSGGAERIDLSSLTDIPSSGNYVLTRGPSPNGEMIPCRRIENWTGWSDWATDRTDFEMVRGTNIDVSGDDGAEGYYYYFFDFLIGDGETRVEAPWSPDVDELYMRPRNPEEEFGDVSPRSLWADTSTSDTTQ